MPQKEVPIGSVEKSFKVVEALRIIGESTVQEVANKTGLPVSTVHVHLNTLKELGYITKDSHHYNIGLKYLRISEYTKQENKLIRSSEKQLKKIAEETGEVAHLMVEEQGIGVHVLSTSGENAVPLDTYAGKRIYLHQTGRGKAIMAHLPKEKRKEIISINGLPVSTDNTITDETELEKELCEIKTRGYAIDQGERIEGLACVASPITNEEGYPIGAISVAGPRSRLQGSYLRKNLADIVKGKSEIIEFNLNFS